MHLCGIHSTNYSAVVGRCVGSRWLREAISNVRRKSRSLVSWELTSLANSRSAFLSLKSLCGIGM